jgi:sRNA-binding regulator protein Hfq
LEVGEKVNRKLIRTTLADVKNRETSAPPRERFDSPREGREGGGYAPRSGGSSHSRPMSHGGGARPGGGGDAMGRKRVPPSETNAEIFYYKKQMDAHTQMVIVLLDGEEVEGTIEWYDRAALKVNRKGAPNILLLKHQIKYMFKAEDRDGGGDDDDSGD